MSEFKVGMRVKLVKELPGEGQPPSGTLGVVVEGNGVQFDGYEHTTYMMPVLGHSIFEWLEPVNTHWMWALQAAHQRVAAAEAKKAEELRLKQELEQAAIKNSLIQDLATYGVTGIEDQIGWEDDEGAFWRVGQVQIFQRSESFRVECTACKYRELIIKQLGDPDQTAAELYTAINHPHYHVERNDNPVQLRLVDSTLNFTLQDGLETLRQIVKGVDRGELLDVGLIPLLLMAAKWDKKQSATYGDIPF